MSPPRLPCQFILRTALLAAAMAAGGTTMADQTLFSFGGAFDLAAVGVTDAKVALDKAPAPGLRVTTGHAQLWPGITLKAPRGTWDLAKFECVAVDLTNTGQAAVDIRLRIDNEGADGAQHCNNGFIHLAPGASGTLSVAFQRKNPGPPGLALFGMRGYPFSPTATGVIDPAKVTQLIIFLATPSADHEFRVGDIRATGAWTAPGDLTVTADKFFPFMDTFGQYIHREWPGKIHSLQEMEAARKAEAADIRQHPGPKGWDKYGGWQDGPALKATGFFRVEKVDGRWWLVDPEGRLFFSHGMDCVNASGDTVITDRQTWFQDFPGAKPEFSAFLGSATPIMHHFQGKRVQTFNFIAANLLRKCGAEWRQASADLAHLRLRSWGMNTIANWSDSATYLMRKTPYTATVGFNRKPIAGSSGYWGKFPDPFEPEFEANVRSAMAAEARRTGDDPWCIGYFIDNEIAWGNDTALGLAALQSPPDQAAKKALVAYLKTIYADIAMLNAAWGTSHDFWDALLRSQAAPDPKRAAADLGAFTSQIADQYFTVIAGAVKSAAPNHLYLGCRFAWVNDRAAAAAATHCDIVSYNRYERSVAGLRLPRGAADKPLIIGEFHFGALDRGMFHTGLVPCADQADRAASCKVYVRSALANPLLVGAHWFQYRDQPTTGRSYDEENYQIGFVDICDTPYPETIAASRELGAEMYALRAKGK